MNLCNIFFQVRYQKRVDRIKKFLEDKFYVKDFANNNISDMSFRNILCLKKDSQVNI